MRVFLVTVLCLLLSAGVSAQTQVERVKAKAERAVQRVVDWKLAGRDPSPVLGLLERVKVAGQAGRLNEAEKLLDEALLLLSVRPSVPGEPVSKEWHSPRKVTIVGYNGNAMEPFITRDGRYLLFNNLNDMSKENTDLHCAARMSDHKFRYVGKLAGANTSSLEGVPSVDKHGSIYFVSSRTYNESLRTLYRGRFSNGKVDRVHLASGNLSKAQPGWLTMDVEVGASGKALYYVEARMRDGLPEVSNICIAGLEGDSFLRDSSSDKLTQHINSDELEYAPSISADGRELFFNRTSSLHRIGGVRSRIMVSRRNRLNEPFGPPQRINAIQGFVEGATIAPGGNTLYYHRRDPAGFRIYCVTR